MELWIGALIQGLIYAFLALGTLLTSKILNFPDITVDGSFTLGAAISAILITFGFNPYFSLIVAFGAGLIAGVFTSLIYTKLKVNSLLAGIIVMTGLYSINLHIMGNKSNVTLFQKPVFTDLITKHNPGLPNEIWIAIIFILLMFCVWLFFTYFLKSDFGITYRATGSNQIMTSATGVNINFIYVIGISLANGLVALSGGLLAQYQGFADIGMGIGTLIIGLTSVIIGEAIFRKPSIPIMVLSAIVGSVVYRYMFALSLYIGLQPIDLKLITAIFMLITLILSKLITDRNNLRQNSKRLYQKVTSNIKKIIIAFIVCLVLLSLYIAKDAGVLNIFTPKQKIIKIGVVQYIDNDLLNITRDSFLKQLETLGYTNGDNCKIILSNAHGDIPSLISIMDNFISEGCDIIVPISTPATQTAINRVKGIPIVFATVANPFEIGVGTNDSVHLTNVTGVYGWVPMDTLMIYVKKIFPDSLKIGLLYDPSSKNVEFNIKNLKQTLKNYPEISYVETNVSNTSEVYNAAQSLVVKGIDAFVQPPDNLVFSALDGIVSAANQRNIPVIICDVEQIKGGALMAFGYDYSVSGKQAAILVDRILKGESPKNIPLERYKKLDLAINFTVAKNLNFDLSPKILKYITIFEVSDIQKLNKIPKIAIVQFGYEPNVEICKKGILAALASKGFEDGKNIEIIYRNANSDFSAINSLIQDLVQKEVDFIVPLSTPVIQSSVQFASNKPNTKVVFCYVFDPYRIGVGKTSSDHLSNFTGVACPPPIEEILKISKELQPSRNKLGVVWNPSEANSESAVLKVREVSKILGYEVIEANISNTNDIIDATRSVISRGANILIEHGDNTLNVGYDGFVKVATEKSIPIVTVDAELIGNGSFIALGPDYFQNGYEGGQYLVRVLLGEPIEKMPIGETKKVLLYINLDVAKQFNYSFPNKIINQADLIYTKNK